MTRTAAAIMLLAVATGCASRAPHSDMKSTLAIIDAFGSERGPASGSPLQASDFECYRSDHPVALRLAGDGATDCGMRLQGGDAEQAARVEDCARAAVAQGRNVVYGYQSDGVDYSFCRFAVHTAGKLWTVGSISDETPRPAGGATLPPEVDRCGSIRFTSSDAPRRDAQGMFFEAADCVDASPSATSSPHPGG